jgi:hypothetical protein
MNHHNPALQSDWTHMGEKYFRFDLLEEVEDYDLDMAEEHFIIELDSWRNGYNATEDGLEHKSTTTLPMQVIDKEKNKNDLNSGPDLQMIKELFLLGVFHFEAGVQKVEDWAEMVVSGVGENARTYLPEVYSMIRKIDDGILNTTGISSTEDTEAYFNGDPSTLCYGPVLDEATYQQAKPYFVNSWKGVKELIDYFYDQFGDNVRPYLHRFLQDMLEDNLQVEQLTEPKDLATFLPKDNNLITTQKQVLSVIGAPHGKTTRQLQKIAIRHMKEWRPKEAAMLEETNNLRSETLKAAERTQKGIRQLMQTGFQHHEAETEMMRRYILLPPEQEMIDEMEKE